MEEPDDGFPSPLVVGGSFGSIPGVAAGLSIQIVGIHFNPSTGQPVYASAAVSFTVN